MTANHFPNMYADKARAALKSARDDLYASLEILEECEAMMNGDEGDWNAIAKLADLAFRNGQAATLPLGQVGTYSLKRASFK